MKSFKGLFFKNIILPILFIIITGVGIFMFLPSTSSVQNALIHLKPKINQYTIFNNRTVRADNPQPWEFAPNVEKKQIAPEFAPDFSKFKTVAFIVAQHNQIIFEQYWRDYTPISLSNSFSISKSMVSLLVGCAITDGYIKSVDQPVSDFLPTWTSYEGRTMTIKDLLTMSVGVDWDENRHALFSKLTNAYYGNNLWKLTFKEKLIEKPGVRFKYQSISTQILAFLLQKATNQSISEYASEKIWTPIQAEEDAQWSLDSKNGVEKAFCCFNSNARDFARLGQLVLNKGKWGLEQVVDSNYIKEAVKPATWLQYELKSHTNKNTASKFVPCTFYGYNFWILNYGGLNIPYMRGALGQYVFIIPELDAVIVRLGEKRDTKFNEEQDYPKDIELWLNAGMEVINR